MDDGVAELPFLQKDLFSDHTTRRSSIPHMSKFLFQALLVWNSVAPMFGQIYIISMGPVCKMISIDITIVPNENVLKVTMDPLSVTASIAAVVGAVSSIGRSVKTLMSFRGAPATLLALSNEVSELQLIVKELDKVLHKDNKSIQPSIDRNLTNTLTDSKKTLLEVDGLLDSKVIKGSLHGKPLVRRAAWLRNHEKIRKCQEDLRCVRHKLVTALGLVNLSASLRVKVVLEQVQVLAQDIQTQQRTIQAEASQLSHQQKGVAKTLSEMLQAQAVVQECITGMQCNQLTESNSRSPDGVSFRKTAPRNPLIEERGQSGDSTALQTVKVMASHYETCTFDCRCSCHRPKHLKSPTYLHTMLGSIFVGYIGLPMVSSGCDVFECCHNTSAAVQIDYYFPAWFLNRKIHLSFKNRHNSGPEQSLRVSRIVPSASDTIKFVMQGDVQRMKDLLANGQGSPYDTDGTNTPLILAVEGAHLETCQVLLYAGADPYEETRIQLAYDKAWDMILGNQVDHDTVQGLRRLFSNNDALGNRQFTILHKAVLGLVPVQPSTIIEAMSCSQVNETDAHDQTALCWAANQGAVENTKLLLRHGGNPNISPVKGDTPLQSAARARSYDCVRMLLDAGAHEDFQGAALMTALHIAAINGAVDVVEVLLAHGAYVDGKSQLGETALMFARVHGHWRVTEFLIEHGANIHQRYPQGETVFHAACWGNDPETVRILLRKDINYRVGPPWLGTVLHAAARFVSVEIARVLTEAGLEGIDIDEKLDGYTALEYAAQRRDVPPGWIQAFKALLESVN